jgi:hypothetical protein
MPMIQAAMSFGIATRTRTNRWERDRTRPRVMIEASTQVVPSNVPVRVQHLGAAPHRRNVAARSSCRPQAAPVTPSGDDPVRHCGE